MSDDNVELEVLPPVQWLNSPEDLWNLFNLTPKQNAYIYGMSKDVMRRQKNKKRELQRKGRITIVPANPEYEKDPSLEPERQRANQRRKNIAPTAGKRTLDLVNIQIPHEHARYHEQLQKALEEQGHLSKARFSDYQMGMKNADGEFEAHDLKAARFEVKFDSEPQWLPVTPVALEKPLKRTYEKAKNPTDWQTTVVIPDIQYPGGDERAIAVMLNIVKTLKPDNIIQLGDLLDLSDRGRFVDSKGDEWANSTQTALIQALTLFRELRVIAPSAKIAYIEGNHERRVPRDILVNHAHNFNIRPADDLEGDPLVSVPRMIGLDGVDVEYLPGYPNNRYWINDNLQIIHGNLSGKNETKRTLMSEKVSTIYGHTHRLGIERQTVNFRDGAILRQGYNAGTLSRIDRTIPGTNTGYDLRGRPVSGGHDNWQQGFLIITHNDQNHFAEEVLIDTFNNYQAMFRGKIYESDHQ